MIGMTIAILVSLLILPHPGISAYLMIAVGVVIGGGIGYVVAQRIEMTAMPQLVAAFHSLVGLAAVFVAVGAFLSPGDFGITGEGGAHSPSPGSRWAWASSSAPSPSRAR